MFESHYKSLFVIFMLIFLSCQAYGKNSILQYEQQNIEWDQRISASLDVTHFLSNLRKIPLFDFNLLQKAEVKELPLSAKNPISNESPRAFEKFSDPLFWLTLFTLAIILLFLFNLFNQRKKQLLMCQVNSKLDQLVKEKTSELSETSEKLNKLINTLPSPVFYKDSKCVYQMCNDAFANLIIGLPKEKIIGRGLSDLQDNIPPHLAELYNAQDLALMKKTGTQCYEARVECADVSLRDYIFHKATLSDATGKVTGIIGVMHDITERKKIEKNLKESEGRFRRLQEASFEGIAIHKKGILIDANQRLCEMTGYTHQELIAMDGLMLFSPNSRGKIEALLTGKNTSPYEAQAIKKDGTLSHVEIRSRQVLYQGEMARVVVIRDITEQLATHKEREKLIGELELANKQLNRIAITDALTGIYNRGYIFQRLSQELKEAQRYGTELAIVMFDIDFFKRVNDSKGHQVGDFVIQQVSQTIAKCIRECDLIGRYGGEEFLLILPHTNLASGYLLANKIRKVIESLVWEYPDFKITVSGGIAEYKGESEQMLLLAADTHLYHAKAQGRNRINK